MAYGVRRPDFADEVELDVPEGLEPFAIAELEEVANIQAHDVEVCPGTLRLWYAGDRHQLFVLRSVAAAYLVLTFPVPRPRALLGHEHFTRLCTALDEIRALFPTRYRTLRLSAAGEDSYVLERLKAALAAHTALEVVADEGDLLLRLRRARRVNGWEVLVRLTPRPLATRDWRVCNRPGAPNAVLAHAMMRMTQPRDDDRVLNLACGSGTLLIERLLLAPARVAMGCDLDRQALDCAARNLQAAGFAQEAQLEAWDATLLPLPTASFDVLCVDLPFGQLVGSHRNNEALYPRMIRESARIAAPGAVMVALTHEVRLFERTLEQHADLWETIEIVRVRSGGMSPRIYLLKRRDAVD